jgi:flavin-dependent dehydrogenase
VAVVGGGPAAAAAAITLRRAGRQVLVLQPPPASFRVGESAPPELRIVLDQLGVFLDFLRDGHLESRGTMSAWGSDHLGYRDFLFEPQGHGWHLNRVRFDAALLAAARSAGATVVPWRCVGTRVAVDGHLLLTCRAGPPSSGTDVAREVVAKAVVDASGRRAVVGTGVGARRRMVDRLVGVSAIFEVDVDARGPIQARTLVEAAEHGWWYAAPCPAGT